MPIYEYRCKNCTHELEIMQKMLDEPLTQCPQCGQNSLDKLISRSSFRLKGNGWYETDFKNSSTKLNKTVESSDNISPSSSKSDEVANKKENKISDLTSEVKSKNNSQDKKQISSKKTSSQDT